MAQKLLLDFILHIQPRSTQLVAVQGSAEKRKVNVENYVDCASQARNEAMLLENQRRNWLSQLAG